MRAQTRAALSGAHVDAVSARLTEALRKVLKIADREASSALSRLADVVRTPRGALSALVVANPSGFAREQVVAFEVEAVDGRWPALTDGRRRLPYQIQRVSSEAAGSRARAVFLASLPALAFRAYWLVAGGTALPVAPERAVTTAGENRLRNGWLTALLDPQSGAVASVVHRARDRVYPLGDLGVLVVAAAPRPGARRRAEVWTFAAEGQDILEGGPIAAALRVNGRLGPSRASLTYRVSQATRSIAVEGFVDFVEPCGALDVLFPRPGGAERLVHEIPYGAIARGEGEFPALGFVDLSAADHGLTLLGDGFATCRVEAKRIGLRVGGSLARVHELAETGAPLIGPCAFRYALFPREGAADAAGLHRRSEDFRSPFFVWQGPPGQARGCRAKRTVGAALELSTEAIEVGALYDDDDGATILRLIERCGRRIEARIRPRWRYRRAETTDLLGRPAQPLKPRRWPTRWGELELFFRPFEIKTLRLT
jgi:hypothetical protein